MNIEFLDVEMTHLLGSYMRWVVKIENNAFNSLNCFIISTSQIESMFAAIYCDFGSLKSGLFHFTGQPNSQKSKSKSLR